MIQRIKAFHKAFFLNRLNFGENCSSSPRWSSELGQVMRILSVRELVISLREGCEILR